jgi:membrane fusion protein (multidrug efflux system)
VLEEGVEENAILVPQVAVSRDSKGNPLVMSVKPDNTVEPRAIQVGRVVGDKWLVTGGLAAGDRVIVEGLQKAKPGAKVKPVQAAAQPAPAGAPLPAGNQANATADQASPAPAAKPAAKADAASQPAPKAQAAAKTAEKPTAPTKATAIPATPKSDVQPTKSVQATDTSKVSAKPKDSGKKRDSLVYSPPKDEPWPGTTAPMEPARDTDPKPEQ